MESLKVDKQDRFKIPDWIKDKDNYQILQRGCKITRVNGEEKMHCGYGVCKTIPKGIVIFRERTGQKVIKEEKYKLLESKV